MDIEFNARKFLEDNFHDAEGLLAYLRAKNIKELPSRAAVDKWFSRNSVPSDWQAVLTGFLEGDRNGTGQIAPYLAPRE